MRSSENTALLPLIISGLLTTLIIISSIHSGVRESNRIINISIILFTIWIVIFLSQLKMGYVIAKTKCQFFGKLIFTMIISTFLVTAIWSSGYLTLNTGEALINGTVHRDTLWQSTIAESIKIYGYSSHLMQDASFFAYHFGSNAIMALLSMIFNVSVFNTYNYLYPLIFIPLYAFLILSVIIEIKKNKNQSAKLTVLDYIILSSFFIGFLPSRLLSQLGIWKSSWVVSETFLIALVFFLIYVIIMLKLRVYKNDNSFKLPFYIITPIFIIICTLCKVSVGGLLAVAFVYLDLRMNYKKISHWIMYGLLFLLFLFFYTMFSGPEGWGGIGSIRFLSFVRTHTKFGLAGFAWHYFFLLLFTLIVVFYQLSVNNPLKQALINKKLIFEETLIIITIVSIIPDMFLNIHGGSGVYFSYFQELIAIGLLLGYNIPDKLYEKIQTRSLINKTIFVLSILLLSLTMLINSEPINALKMSKPFYAIRFITGIEKRHEKENTFLSNIYSIAMIPQYEKKHYGIFINDDAEVWDLLISDVSWYNHRVLLFYPALTGIRILNYKSIDGDSISINLNESLEVARENNLRFVIHFFNDTYEIIKL